MEINICEWALKGMISGFDESPLEPEKEDFDNFLFIIMEINDDLKKATSGEPNNPIEEELEGLEVKVMRISKN